MAMRHRQVKILVLLLAMLATLLVPAHLTHADESTIALPNGAFFTQTSHQPGYGFAITDEDLDSRGQVIRLWSEFQRLGGAEVLGYPISQRFYWDGFVCQATQRVILQWRPETGRVTFVNVFDLVHQAGKDAYLQANRQIPLPA